MCNSEPAIWSSQGITMFSPSTVWMLGWSWGCQSWGQVHLPTGPGLWFMKCPPCLLLDLHHLINSFHACFASSISSSHSFLIIHPFTHTSPLPFSFSLPPSLPGSLTLCQLCSFSLSCYFWVLGLQLHDALTGWYFFFQVYRGKNYGILCWA